MANKSNKYGVIVAVAGQTPKMAEVTTGGTVRSALLASGMSENEVEHFSGEIRVGAKRANLTDRLTKGALISITPKVAGGR